MRNILAIIGVAAIGWFLLSKLVNNVISAISFESVGLKLGGLTPSGLEISVPITLRNNTNLSIPIESFRGSLIYGTQEIAPVFINVPTTINAQASSTIQVESKISFLAAAQDLLDLINSKQYLNNLRLVGQLSYQGVGIPIDHVIKII